MKIDLQIEMENAAFEDHGTAEIRRLLLRVESMVEDILEEEPPPRGQAKSRKLLDLDGNSVGWVRVTN